jgi:hypothetical protein
MTTAAVEGAEIMTDFQFKAVLDLVIGVLEEKGDIQAAIEKLKRIRNGKDEPEIKDILR